jgi:biopolymer transport protein ExbD
MRNKPVSWIVLGVVLGVLLTIGGMVVHASAEERKRRAEVDQLVEQAISKCEAGQRVVADIDRRAAENARPQPEEFKGSAVVIELKNDANGVVIEVGDGTTMRPKERQALPEYLKAMRRDGKKQAELRVDGEAEWKSAHDIIEEAQRAGFEKIILQQREKK